MFPRRHKSTGNSCVQNVFFLCATNISYILIVFLVSDRSERTKRSLEPNRKKRSRDGRSTSHKHLEVAMVADDLVVKTHGDENLEMYLLILAHVVKKLYDWNYQLLYHASASTFNWIVPTVQCSLFNHSV